MKSFFLLVQVCHIHVYFPACVLCSIPTSFIGNDSVLVRFVLESESVARGMWEISRDWIQVYCRKVPRSLCHTQPAAAAPRFCAARGYSLLRASSAPAILRPMCLKLCSVSALVSHVCISTWHLPVSLPYTQTGTETWTLRSAPWGKTCWDKQSCITATKAGQKQAFRLQWRRLKKKKKPLDINKLQNNPVLQDVGAIMSTAIFRLFVGIKFRNKSY